LGVFPLIQDGLTESLAVQQRHEGMNAVQVTAKNLYTRVAIWYSHGSFSDKEFNIFPRDAWRQLGNERRE
jgi:hypothetical protein